MLHFSECNGLAPQVLASLERMKFQTPTPIQAQAIPLALAGRDILGSAQTGTGKTGAFCIPMISKLLSGEVKQALVLTPTRELAVQVMASIELMLGKNGQINTALLVGGQDIHRQFFQLRKNPKIIVATPGRLNDHIERRSVNLSQVGYLVLDETDRMLDMGFGVQIDRIISQIPMQAGQRQTLMFSATMPKNINQMAAKYLNNPERIAIGSCLQPVAAIAQESIRLADAGKYDQLVKELENRQGAVVVFVKTKHNAQKIADRLYDDNIEAEAIHGNLRQNKRDRVIAGFRNKKFRVLVATDVAARGLDVPHIEHVINHDLPQCPEDYIHRIGRTARAGAKGSAVNFISRGEEKLWRAIERFMNTGEQDGSGFSGRERTGGNKNFGKKSFGFAPRSNRFGGQDRDGQRFQPRRPQSSEGQSEGQGDENQSRPSRFSRFGDKKRSSNSRPSNSFRKKRFGFARKNESSF